MLPLLAAVTFAGPIFAKPIPWALGFAPAGRLPMAGDVDADGFADLVCLSPSGDAFIDVALNAGGAKSLVPQRANSNWGKDAQAATFGEIDETAGTDLVAICGGDTLRLAHAFKSGSFKDEASWAKLPKKLRTPHLAFVEGAVFAWDEKLDPATNWIRNRFSPRRFAFRAIWRGWTRWSPETAARRCSPSLMDAC